MKEIIKKILIITIYIGLIFISTKSYATSTGTTTSETTRIRKEASTSSDTLALISKNTEVEVIAEEGEWYKVKYETHTGYIRKDIIDVKGEIAQSETTTSNSVSNSTLAENSTNNTTVNSDTTTNTTSNTIDSAIVNNNESEDNSISSDEVENTINNNQTSEQTASKQANIENLLIGYKGNILTSIDVRILPTINSSVTVTLPEKTEITIKDIINKWCYIETESNDGWTLLSKIECKDEKISETTLEDNVEENGSEVDKDKAENENKTTEDSIQTEEKQETQTKYVSTETLNVRENPENDAKIVSQLTLNTQVTIIEEVDGTWSKVKIKETTGYVASKYLSSTKIENTSRSENETRSNSDNTISNESKKEENVSANNNSTTNYATDTTESKNTSGNSTNSRVIGASVVQYAKQYLGYRYVSGGTSPSTGFDCSGFTYYVYKHFGFTLNRTSAAQISNGVAVQKANLSEGDIIIFNNSSNSTIGHVGIYIGGNTFIHAANSSKGVITTSLSDSYYSKRYVAARRIIN